MTSNTAVKLVACVWLLLLTTIVLGGYACPRCNDVEPLVAIGDPGLCNQHLVQINVTRYAFEPMGNAWLEPVRNESYQVSSGNRVIAGTTDGEGTFAIPMCPMEKYRIDVSNKTIWLYPHESNYQVMLK